MTPDKKYPKDLDALLSTVAPDEAARLCDVWDLAGSEEPIDYPTSTEADLALARLNQSLDERRVQPRPSKPFFRADRQSKRPRRHGVGTHGWVRSGVIAVAILLIGAFGVFLWQRPLVKTAAPGERLAVLLPDGSTVELNSGSTVRYPRSFGEVRTVKLEGEAFFDVQKSVQPFMVYTYNARVQVLGTTFGVRAWPERAEDGTTVALATGRVALAAAAQPEHVVTLEPGQTRRVLPSEHGVDAIDEINASVEEATAWRRGDLVFKDQRLGVILDDVERRFAIQLHVAPEIAQRRLNLALRQPANAEAVVRDVTTALGLKYRATSDGYEVY